MPSRRYFERAWEHTGKLKGRIYIREEDSTLWYTDDNLSDTPVTHTPAGGSLGEVLTKASDADFEYEWAPPGSSGDHPDLAAHDTLGLATDVEVEDLLDAHELAPDPHTGYALDSDLSAYQATAQKGVAGGYASLDGGGQVPDAQIPSTIARDSELPDLAGHIAAGDPHSAYALDTDLTTHAGAADPHAGYRLESADHTHASSGLQGGTIDHGVLTGLSDDDHPQYALDTDLTTHAGASDPHTGYVLESLLDAKGDIIAASADNTPAKVTVGANDTILMADSTAGAGLKWVAPTATPSTQAFGDAAAGGSTDDFTRGDHKHAMPANPVTAHEAAGDPHTGYRLESADHTHATTGLQGGTVAHSVLTGVTADQHHTENHQARHNSGGADALQLDNLAAPDDNTDLNASLTAHGLLLKLGGGSTNFLRADGTWSAPPSGGTPTATTVEANLGTPRWQGKFTITDAAIGTTSKVLCWQAPGPYTGKGTRADEAGMQPVNVVSVEPLAGSAVVTWETPPAYAPIIQGMDGGGDKVQVETALVLATPQMGRSSVMAGSVVGQRRIGKVNGNVKFSYMIFA